ncbi:MAG: hypothetical protein Sv326_0492 [Candidatus Fermentimicrarchaeum limneticum]|uniref:Uncharacterized protein n=1 Tax=Fermentimicrarchaeum limneticum TaxID=2795018 RepID=A0A7D5XPL6_FERL1|nr:MAG: hypothetical protein Sv326_0492 [Candidatus Fermentimicrarchaeum limneticum]
MKISTDNAMTPIEYQKKKAAHKADAARKKQQHKGGVK